MTPGPGIEPRTHWWKASALTTVPTLLFKDTEPRQEPPSTPGTSGTTPSVEKTEIDGVSCLMNTFTNYNISGHVADILMASWRSSTQKQCKTYIEQWPKFCGERKIN